MARERYVHVYCWLTTRKDVTIQKTAACLIDFVHSKVARALMNNKYEFLLYLCAFNNCMGFWHSTEVDRKINYNRSGRLSSLHCRKVPAIA